MTSPSTSVNRRRNADTGTNLDAFITVSPADQVNQGEVSFGIAREKDATAS